MIGFEVIGVPKTKGSASAIPYIKKNNKLGVRVFNSCKTEKAWARTVEREARKHAPESPISGPVGLQVEFRLPPHASWRGELYHTKPPDLDKLTRSIKDALTKGGIYHDDKQVCLTFTRKTYDTTAGVTVLVWEIYQIADNEEGLSHAKRSINR